MGTKNSRLQGFYQLNPFERLQMVKSFDGLVDEDLRALHGGSGGALTIERADKMIENVVGTYNLPLGIATNFRINGRDYLIPMVVEEPSIVAGASYAARMVRDGGGFETSSTEPLMIGQVQLVHVAHPDQARQTILARKEEILALANAQSRSLVTLGGGARDVEVRFFPTSPMGPMLVVHLIVDCRDAMGANAVNTMAEAVAPLLAEMTGGKVYLRILSNLTDRRLARARCVVPAASLARDGLSGEEVVEGILWAYAFAAVDPYRAATHNKGIMNGIDPVLVATGNDWRAVEAGAPAATVTTPHSRTGSVMSRAIWLARSKCRSRSGLLAARPKFTRLRRQRSSCSACAAPTNWPRSVWLPAWPTTSLRCAHWPVKASSRATWGCMPAKLQWLPALQARWSMKSPAGWWPSATSSWLAPKRLLPNSKAGLSPATPPRTNT